MLFDPGPRHALHRRRRDVASDRPIARRTIQLFDRPPGVGCEVRMGQ